MRLFSIDSSEDANAVICFDIKGYSSRQRERERERVRENERERSVNSVETLNIVATSRETSCDMCEDFNEMHHCLLHKRENN